MTAIDWDHYQIPLSAQPPRARTPAPKTLARPLAGRGARLGAYVVDYSLGLAPVVVAFIITKGWGENAQTTMVRLWIWIGGRGAILLIQMILLAFRGQSLGKMIAGVRIVNKDDDGNPGFVQAVVLRHMVPGLIGTIPCFGALFRLADCLFILNDDRRCLHDWIAGTKVVET
jgi:uncharacterized RDD family membrane protein YckC